MPLWSLHSFWFLCFFCFSFIGFCHCVVCGYQQVYIVSVIIYYYSIFFLFYVSSSLVWLLLVNNLTLLILFTAYCVLSYVFVWCCTYFFIEKSDFSSLGFFSVLECSYPFSVFCFCQSCAKFIQTSAFF